MGSASPCHNPKILLYVVPITVLVALFVSLVTYVSWSLHLFYPAPLSVHVDCDKYEGVNAKLRLQEYKLNRTVQHRQIDFDENKCYLIRKRRYLPTDVPDSMEVHYHMYFLRIVSKDYDFLEEVMAMMYSPLHFYCYVIDSGASPKFERLVRMLGECILNIIVPPGLYNTTTTYGTFLALNSCYTGMEKYEWKHTIITAENEMPVHSVHYIADNSRRLGNAARIGRVTISEEYIRIIGHNLSKANQHDQDFVRRSICTWFLGRRFPLTLPRSFQPVLFKFLLEQDMEHCQPLSPDFDKSVALEECHTNHFDDRGNCLIGMEDYEETKKSKRLFARADPNFDHGIVQCVNQFVYRRTYANGYGQMFYS